MPEEDVRREYDIAMELYKEGAYSESLVLLERLAKERPDSKHVMYSRGLCVLAMGRIEEGRAFRDQLMGLRSSSARQYADKLNAILKEKTREREKAAAKDWARVKATSRTTETIEDAHGSPAKAIAIVLVILACVAGAAWFVFQQRHAPRPVSEEAKEMESFTSGTTPDRYLEVAAYYPSGTERSFRYAVVVAPAEGEVSNTATDDKDDCAGNPTVSDWPDVKARAKKALAMSNSSSEELRGVPRDKTVVTIVLPRMGLPLSKECDGMNIERFNPGGMKQIADVIAACGKPEREETWSQRGEAVALIGPTQWWGRVGLAADASGAITHVLIRAYPGDKR